MGNLLSLPRAKGRRSGAGLGARGAGLGGQRSGWGLRAEGAAAGQGGVVQTGGQLVGQNEGLTLNSTDGLLCSAKAKICSVP